MFQGILTKIGIGVVAIVTAIAGIFIPSINLDDRVLNLEQQFAESEDMPFGSYYPVAGGRYKLAGSGIGLTDSSIILRSFTMPVSGLELSMSNFGTIGYATIEPGTSKKEFISFTGVSQNGANTEATLTGVSRGLSFVSPYTASTTLRQTHSGGTRLILSNSPQLYAKFASKDNAESITGLWTFDADVYPKTDDSTTDPTDDAEFATKGYADALAVSGSPAGSTTTAGIFEVANSDELLEIGTTIGDTGKILILPLSYFATSTDKRNASTTVVMTDTDGKIDQTFYDLTEDFTLTGNLTSSAITTLNSTTTIGDANTDALRINASTTHEFITAFNDTVTFKSATSSFDRPPTIDSSSANATATDFYFLANQGYVDNSFSGKFTASSSDSITGIVAQANTATSTPAAWSTYLKAKDIEVPYAGTYYARVDFKVNPGGQTAYVQFYVNDVAYGSASSTTLASYLTYGASIYDVSADDNIQVYYKGDGGGTTVAYLKNFRICGYIVPVGTVVKN